MTLPANHDNQPGFGVAFMLRPGFPLLAFAAAVEPLRMANELAGRDLYHIFTCSDDGAPVASSAGMTMQVDGSLRDLAGVNALYLVDGSGELLEGRHPLLARLRQLAREGVALGGIGTGSLLLAQAGQLNGRRATVHWRQLDLLRENFPAVQAVGTLFEIDGDRHTCSGGTAAMDMMLFLIAQALGRDVAAEISERLVCERIRPGDEPQRVPLKARIGAAQPKLIEAVALMEANIEEPLSTDDIAFHVGVSRRHLERLFKRHLDTVPSRYYLELRMERARQLLQQSDKPVLQVALACGFSSASHFSTAYRSHFGVTPREERKRATGPDRFRSRIEHSRES